MSFNKKNNTSADTQVPQTSTPNYLKGIFNMLNNIKPFKTDLPYTIHAAPICDKQNGLYPTHTHGLTDIGMPEFIMDPLAFGPEGNADKIHRACSYFKRNKKGLELILSGQTVKLPIKRICPKWKNAPNYKLCFREVGADFQAVREAYLDDIDPDMKFIQIYVDGDDFALTDDYYRGGVKY